MNITGNINLFEKEYTSGDRIYTFYHTSIFKIKEDGGVISMNIDVYFKDKTILNDYIPTNDGKIMYCLNLKRAYLSVRTFKRKDGSDGIAPTLVVDEYSVVSDSPVVDFNE